MNKREPISIFSLISALTALVIGIVFCIYQESVFDVIGYAVSGILIFSGALKAIFYLIGRRRNGTTLGDFMMGIFLVAAGVLIACFPSFIPTTISLVLGFLILFNGINRLILCLALKRIEDSGFTIFLVEAILMILVGIIVMTKWLLPFIGVLMIIYALSELVGYIYYVSQSKDYSEVLTNKKVPKEVKEKEAKDAVIEEE